LSNSIVVPPPQYQAPFTTQGGIITPVWSKWIEQLYLRIGGASSPSNAGFASDISTLQTDVAAINTEITTIQVDITLLQGLTNGRQL
jgi:hypothetical protein